MIGPSGTGALALARLGRRIRAGTTSLLVGAIYATALLVARLAPWRRTDRPSIRRVVLVGTFYNRGWFVSHATPLAGCGVRDVIVVTDEPQAPIDGVRFFCPPPLAVTLLGRTPAKFVWLLVAGLRHRPDLYMGYHLMPCAVMALVAARLLGGRASYQMTGGPTEVIGGGFEDENPVLHLLARPRPWLQSLALRLVRRFDQVVVRGSRARTFLLQSGVAPAAIAVIPGSVQPTLVPAGAPRPYALVFVGRLVGIKQPGQFVEILASVARSHPTVRALIVGDGPLRPALEQQAAALGVAEHLDFAGRTDRVQPLLARARVFVLTSRSEGLSIALAEAMISGVVPVVARVGDLEDLVQDGVNGYAVEPDDIAAYVARVQALLDDPGLWSRLSSAAATSALRHAGLDNVTSLWQRHLHHLALPAEPLQPRTRLESGHPVPGDRAGHVGL